MVDQVEIEDMKRILSMLNGTAEIVIEKSSLNEDISMQSFMNRINESNTETTIRLFEDAQTDYELAEALVTEPTSNGVRIGEWEIVIHDEGDMKTYDIVETISGEKTMTALALHEAAYGLVKLLNTGYDLNSAAARQIIALEEQYEQAFHDAVFFKHRIKNLYKKGDFNRAAIMEDRYDVAKQRAIFLKESMKSTTSRL